MSLVTVPKLGGNVMRAAAVQKRPPVTKFVSKLRLSANIGGFVAGTGGTPAGRSSRVFLPVVVQ